MLPPPPPPRLADLRAGTRLVAGNGYATVLPDLDFETYSEAGFVWDVAAGKWACLPHAAQGRKGISVVQAARYAEHPSTRVLVLSYDLKDGRGRRRWLPGQPFPDDLYIHIITEGLLEAWHVIFERQIWEKVCVLRMGWPPVKPHQWRCAMAKARAHALPGALDAAGAVLGTAAQKDKQGTRLLKKFSVPRDRTKADDRLFIDPATDPEGPLLYQYCEQDIAAEAEISSVTPDLPLDELEYWQVDQEINMRGVQIDLDSVRACTAIVEQALARYNRELFALTDRAVEAASQIQRLTAWTASQGVSLYSLDEDSIDQALTRNDLPPQVRRALEIRQTVGSASVKKLFAMANQVCDDGRLRGLFTYHGARTGRVTGNGPQPTNLAKAGPNVRRCLCGRYYGAGKVLCPWCGLPNMPTKPVEWSVGAAEDALAVMRAGSLDLAEMYFDDAMPAISGCLRGMFVAAPGYDLIASDYSAIEAVVLAQLAGEEWRLEVFRTHGKIYEASASKITGIPLEEILDHRKRTGQHHSSRAQGKIAELALGYGGFVGALVAFGADEFMTEDQMREVASAWRRASPAIVEFWGGQSRFGRPEMFGIEGAAVSAVLSPGQTFGCRGIQFEMISDALYCRLLSGRYLTYHRPRLRPSERRYGDLTLSYEGWNSNPKNGPMGWIRMDTYGPKLVENIAQATSRDIQRHSLVQAEKQGYPIVLHVYDENVAEVPEGWGSIEAFEAIMNAMPPWAAGWPIRAAGGWRGKRYRKE